MCNCLDFSTENVFWGQLHILSWWPCWKGRNVRRKKRCIVLKRNKKVTALNVILGYQEKAFQSQIGGSCCFHSLQFYLISTVFFSFTQMLLVMHWSASLTLQPICVCMCKLIIVVRDCVRVFRLSLPSGTAAGYAIILEYFGRRKVGESKSQVAV